MPFVGLVLVGSPLVGLVLVGLPLVGLVLVGSPVGEAVGSPVGVGFPGTSLLRVGSGPGPPGSSEAASFDFEQFDRLAEIAMASQNR